MKDPAFLFYPKDFLEGTSEMTYEEIGIYTKLLSHQWLRGKLPSSKDRLSRLLKIPLRDLEGYPYVFEKFTIDGEDMFNERLEEERGRREKFKETASLSGIKGQFMKQQKAIMSPSEYKKLEERVNELIINPSLTKGTLKGMLKGCLSNKANANKKVNSNQLNLNVDSNKEATKKLTREQKLVAVKKQYQKWFMESDNQQYKKFLDWLVMEEWDNLTKVLLLDGQLDYEKYKKSRAKIKNASGIAGGDAEYRDTILRMANWNGLEKKKSFYLTLTTWLGNDNK